MTDKIFKLGFDPVEHFGAMWDDAEARILWLLWRPVHIVPVGFEAYCLDVAKTIRQIKPTTVGQLIGCFPGLSDYWTPDDVARFAPDALPYFTGQMTVGWEIVKK